MTLSDVKCFLLDMDGTFYLGSRALPGSLDFIEAVRRTGRDFLFLTNNSSHNAKFYVERLRKMGLTIPREKVLTSGESAAQYLLKTYPNRRVFCLGNEFLREELSEVGVPLSDDAPDLVLVGYDTTLDYRKMTAVCDFVRAGLPYVATHPDFNCPTETGFAPDIGAIMAFIEASTGRRADAVIGKPQSGIVEAAVLRTGFPKTQMAMVGDRLYTDIETGRRNQMLSILVLTGETTPEMLKDTPYVPDLVFDRLSSMIPLL